MPDKDPDLKPPEILPAHELEIPPEGTRTPEEGDSLLGMLARKRHPEHFEEEPPEPPEGEKEPSEPPEPPEVKAGEEKPSEPPEEPPKKKEPAPEPPEFKPKYKSQEEAERAYEEAQRKMHEATTQAAKEREERERLAQEAEELRRQLAEKEKPPEKTPEELEAEQEAKIIEALDEIAQLDESDSDYRKKVAKAWRKAGVGGAGQPAAPKAEDLEKLIDQRLAERQRLEQEQDEEEVRQIRSRATELAREAGLNMEEDSEDFDLFWKKAGELPPELRGKPLEEQANWAIEEAKKLRKPSAATTPPTLTDEEKELIELGREYKAKLAQKENAVLGTGGNKLPPSKEPQQETFSMGSILRQQRQARQTRSST